MSWHDFQVHKENGKQKSKRRRLFQSDFNNENKPSNEDFIAAPDDEIIASFDSESESNSPRKLKKKCNLQHADSFSQSYNDSSSYKLLEASSIDSFESDSSAVEYTPTKDVESVSVNPNFSKQNNSRCLSISNSIMKNTCKDDEFGKMSIKTMNVNFETMFSSSFSDLEETLKLDLSNSCTPTKQSATSWLNGIKSPETKQLPLEDRSAKKILSKKHPTGSLAQKAHSMSRSNKGEYLMWLHKNIHSSCKPPFDDSCYYGLVQNKSMIVKYNMLCISTTSLDISKRNVIVLIPGDKKCGVFKKEILVVFPEFYCSIEKSEYTILALFHAHFFDRNQFSFEDFSKRDHFLGVPVLCQPDKEPQSSKNKSTLDCIPNYKSVVSSHCLADLHVCVYHLRINDDNVQILGFDKKENLTIAEIPLAAARPIWDQIALSFGLTCFLTSLELCHVSLAYKCVAWFPQIELFSDNYKQKIYCFEQRTGSIKLLDGIDYNEKFLSHQGQSRSDLLCRYLGTIKNINDNYLTYVLSILGTIQWIEHKNCFKFPYGTLLKFTFVKSVNPMHYEYDNLSSVFISLNYDKTFNITFPNLYTFEDEDGPSDDALLSLCLSPYNKHLPKYMPCSVSLIISSIDYKNKKFHVIGQSCGTLVDIIVEPYIIRSLLGTSCIAECDLVHLKGHSFNCKGIVVDKCTVVENQLDFLKL